MQKTRLLYFKQITSQPVSQPAHFERHAQKGAGLQPQHKTALLHQTDQTDQSGLEQTDQINKLTQLTKPTKLTLTGTRRDCRVPTEIFY